MLALKLRRNWREFSKTHWSAITTSEGSLSGQHPVNAIVNYTQHSSSGINRSDLNLSKDWLPLGSKFVFAVHLLHIWLVFIVQAVHGSLAVSCDLWCCWFLTAFLSSPLVSMIWHLAWAGLLFLVLSMSALLHFIESIAASILFQRCSDFCQPHGSLHVCYWGHTYIRTWLSTRCLGTPKLHTKLEKNDVMVM